MHILMIFLDGVGLGDNNPDVNPFVAGNLPTIRAMGNGSTWLKSSERQETDRAILIPTDPRLGVSGRPQSGTGQATIVTGRNIPKIIGQHYGPKPNQETRALLDEDNFFKQLAAKNKTSAILEAYPPEWHALINRGKRLPASYQYAALSAGLTLSGEDELRAGTAISGDWTGEGWRTQLNYTDTPQITAFEAGKQLVILSRKYDFAFFPHWLTDIVGHRGPMERAVELLEAFDQALAGILSEWQDDEGLVVVTSDHGNIEEIGNRKHTENDVPTLVIGGRRHEFAKNITDLSDLVPAIQRLLF